MGRISGKKVGFYCWILFIINNIRGFEVNNNYYIFFQNKFKDLNFTISNF